MKLFSSKRPLKLEIFPSRLGSRQASRYFSTFEFDQNMGAPLVEGVDFGVIVQAEVDSVARAETAVKSKSDSA